MERCVEIPWDLVEIVINKDCSVNLRVCEKQLEYVKYLNKLTDFSDIEEEDVEFIDRLRQLVCECVINKNIIEVQNIRKNDF